ncbi:hypothetical protein PF008_g15607 [Phytophthora fragariae]|uniref:Uncharacterized protein n=1 Tax=Phytophthora fragariae TaxID=53985 RepID=A0A6G0RE25_9STRA|nr:hypothetical protein PF008_g15607 [Phytophthora fragariae]
MGPVGIAGTGVSAAMGVAAHAQVCTLRWNYPAWARQDRTAPLPSSSRCIHRKTRLPPCSSLSSAASCQPSQARPSHLHCRSYRERHP